MPKLDIALNSQGLRIGDSHPNAKLTNHEIDLLLELRDQGFSYLKLANTFGISKSGARFICKGERRCQTPARWKTVVV